MGKQLQERRRQPPVSACPLPDVLERCHRHLAYIGERLPLGGWRTPWLSPRSPIQQPDSYTNRVGIAPDGPAANEWTDADSGLEDAPVPIGV